MDRITLMETFLRVVDGGSFAEAARKGGVSRAAVSKYIDLLEEHLGIRLLNRTTRRLHLTAEGEIYAQRCRKILEEINDAEQTVTLLHGAPRGLLRVSAPMSFGILHLAPAIADFLLAFPGIKIDLALNDRFVDLVEEGFDVAVRIGALENSTLVARRLASARLVLCASPGYVVRHGQPMTPEELTRHACLLYSYTLTPTIWRFFHGGEERSVRINGPLQANNGDAVRAAARAGVGVAILPDFLIEGDLEANTLMALLPEFDMPPVGVYAVYPANPHISAKVRKFIDFLLDRFDKKSGWRTTGDPLPPDSQEVTP
ncbi:MAG: LysR family transcriptional regulator [Magnetococcales bacterium]|nr:LysR family transcriptional regulator [Magnetococcales bacterium]